MTRIPLALAALLVALGAAAVEPTFEVGVRDPWIPPELRAQSAARAKPVDGAELRAQAEQRLRAPFDRAAATTGGLLTREQARTAGLGFIDRHFEAIDRRGAGAVTFEDYKAFLRSRGAALD